MVSLFVSFSKFMFFVNGERSDNQSTHFTIETFTCIARHIYQAYQ